MAFNVSGWGSVEPFATITVGYCWPGGGDHGAQYAEGKPEGALLDGSSNGDLVSNNQEIMLDVASQQISYAFTLSNRTAQLQSFMLCGGGLV
jgi:hypothetical protein